MADAVKALRTELTSIKSWEEFVILTGEAQPSADLVDAIANQRGDGVMDLEYGDESREGFDIQLVSPPGLPELRQTRLSPVAETDAEDAGEKTISRYDYRIKQKIDYVKLAAWVRRGGLVPLTMAHIKNGYDLVLAAIASHLGSINDSSVFSLANGDALCDDHVAGDGVYSNYLNLGMTSHDNVDAVLNAAEEELNLKGNRTNQVFKTMFGSNERAMRRYLEAEYTGSGAQPNVNKGTLKAVRVPGIGNTWGVANPTIGGLTLVMWAWPYITMPKFDDSEGWVEFTLVTEFGIGAAHHHGIFASNAAWDAPPE